MNISYWLARVAQVSPDRPAMYLGTDLIEDYAGFHAKAAAVAGWLAAMGIGPGDRVALFMKNVPDYLIVQYGAWYAGAAVVPINAKLHGREAAWIIGDSGTRLTFASPGMVEDLSEARATGEIVDIGTSMKAIYAADPIPPQDRSPDDLAWLFYTSGTTGRPKGVMITHRMLISMALCYEVQVLSEGETDQRRFSKWLMAYEDASDDDEGRMLQGWPIAEGAADAIVGLMQKHARGRAPSDMLRKPMA